MSVFYAEMNGHRNDSEVNLERHVIHGDDEEFRLVSGCFLPSLDENFVSDLW